MKCGNFAGSRTKKTGVLSERKKGNGEEEGEEDVSFKSQSGIALPPG